MALTNKQRAFVDAYLANGFNATKAAIAAGYSEISARVIGSENLTKPDIKNEVNARLNEMTMNATEALYRLSQHAAGTMEDFLDIENERVDLNKADKNGKLHLIKKFTRTVTDKSERITIELYDAQAALVHILKEQHLRAGEPTEQIALNVSQMTDDELRAIAES